MRIGVEQIMRCPDGLGWVCIDQFVEHGEVELGVVDRVGRSIGRWPSEPRGTVARRAPRKLVEARQTALGGAKNLERIERRHARTAKIEIDAGIRKNRPAASRAYRQPQRQAFARDAISL